MARFYGTIEGGRGQATRCGSIVKGLSTTAASYSGAVFVSLYVDSEDRDCARVTVGAWESNGPRPAVVLYEGPIAEASPELALAEVVKRAERRERMPA